MEKLKKDNNDFEWNEYPNKCNSFQKSKLVYKIPMERLVLDDKNQLWTYSFSKGKVVYHFYGQTFKNMVI